MSAGPNQSLEWSAATASIRGETMIEPRALASCPGAVTSRPTHSFKRPRRVPPLTEKTLP